MLRTINDLTLRLMGCQDRSPSEEPIAADTLLAPPPPRPSARPVFASVASYLQADVPVFVPCFNNPTYTGRMVSQLCKLGFRRIVLMDGGSTYPPMRTLLDAPGDGVSVVTLPGNPGPHHLLRDPAALSLMPRHFCITDPDLVFNPEMPADFLGDLAALTARERVGKAGLALDLSDSSSMRDEPFVINDRAWQIWEWEERFWRVVLEPLRPGGDPVYRADVDTTFALYDRDFLDISNFHDAVRIAGRFTCRHLPWYREKELPKEEENFYRDTQRFSYYLKTPPAETDVCVNAARGPAIPGRDDQSMLQLRRDLVALYASKSWRYTKPLRALGALAGRPTSVELLTETMTLQQFKEGIEGIKASRSWRLTKPLRALSGRVHERR